MRKWSRKAVMKWREDELHKNYNRFDGVGGITIHLTVVREKLEINPRYRVHTKNDHIQASDCDQKR